MNTYERFLKSTQYEQSVAIDFATSMGLNSENLQYVIDSMWVIPTGDTEISIYIERDGSVYLTIYSKDCNILDRAHLIKRKDGWVEIEE